MRATQLIDTGIVYVNAPTIGAEIQLPFGGTKHTGNGFREAGRRGLEQFSETKTVYIDFSGHLQRAQIDNRPPVADS
jgi:aldehyde dehydrogenase (NAD+)